MNTRNKLIRVNLIGSALLFMFSVASFGQDADFYKQKALELIANHDCDKAKIMYDSYKDLSKQTDANIEAAIKKCINDSKIPVTPSVVDSLKIPVSILSVSEIGDDKKSKGTEKDSIITAPVYSAMSWYKEGKKNSDSGNFSEAIRCFRKAIDINPNMSDAWYNLGIAYGREQKNSEALEYYQKAAQLGNIVAQEILTKMGEKW